MKGWTASSILDISFWRYPLATKQTSLKKKKPQKVEADRLESLALQTKEMSRTRGAGTYPKSCSKLEVETSPESWSPSLRPAVFVSQSSQLAQGPSLSHLPPW